MNLDNITEKPELIISVACFHAVLFRLHERDTATEKEFDTVLQMTLEDVLT